MPVKATLGWREWLALPDLGIARIKAKVDTGARTSALHAFALEMGEQDGQQIVRFRIHPLQRNNDLVAECVAPMVDEREVRDSGGHAELRPVIQTRVAIGSDVRTVEVTLTRRDSMGFRMLLGRSALRPGYVVDPSRSYVLGRTTLLEQADGN